MLNQDSKLNDIEKVISRIESQRLEVKREIEKIERDMEKLEGDLRKETMRMTTLDRDLAQQLTKKNARIHELEKELLRTKSK